MNRGPLRQIRPKAASGPFLPYGRQLIEEDDVAAVVEALHGEFLTTGPLVEQFERKLAETVGAADATACCNGTAALFMAAKALDLGPGSRIIVPAITFVATASAPHLAGAEIIFADVDGETGLMRPEDLEEALSRAPDGRADAVFPVHYAGQSCDMAALSSIARPKGMRIVEDAAHALGTAWLQPDGAIVPVGANLHGDLTIFSFHPVKTIAMGEGGAVSTNDPALMRRLKQLRNHGITREAGDFLRPRAAFDEKGDANPWYYELHAPGFNFRVPDLNCALGLSQLAKLPRFVAHRAALVAAYDELLAPVAPVLRPLARERRSASAWHLYAVRIDFAEAGVTRAALMTALRGEGIGTQVHYVPVNRQPYFAARTGPLVLPGAEHYYAHTLSLPLHAGMTEDDVERVCAALTRHLG
jgi:UDP-4-amino-4,6-dideoxy-N-acetyl-beta-L-altrosamine transaminase